MGRSLMHLQTTTQRRYERLSICTGDGLGVGDTLRSPFLGKSAAAGSQLLGEHQPVSSFSRAPQEHEGHHLL